MAKCVYANRPQSVLGSCVLLFIFSSASRICEANYHLCACVVAHCVPARAARLLSPPPPPVCLPCPLCLCFMDKWPSYYNAMVGWWHLGAHTNDRSHRPQRRPVSILTGPPLEVWPSARQTRGRPLGGRYDEFIAHPRRIAQPRPQSREASIFAIVTSARPRIGPR